MAAAKPSSLVDPRVVDCGDRRCRFPFLDQLKNLPDACVDLIYRGGGVRDKRRQGNGRVDPPFNSNRNYEVFWGEANEKRAYDY